METVPGGARPGARAGAPRGKSGPLHSPGTAGSAPDCARYHPPDRAAHPPDYHGTSIWAVLKITSRRGPPVGGGTTVLKRTYFSLGAKSNEDAIVLHRMTQYLCYFNYTTHNVKKI
jgi:hypothetical protein